MGLLESLGFRKREEPVVVAQGQPVKSIEVGSAGTEIFAGYIHEEYLAELRGKEWADIVDKMYRSDPNVKMITSALVLPLKSTQWMFSLKKDLTPEQMALAEHQKKLMERIFFEDLAKNGKSFTRVIGEIFSFIRHGYSLFELTYKAVIDDPQFGSYNSLKSMAWRSQRTIEKWNVDKAGNLESVTQIVNGDLAQHSITDLDARFLVHFAPEMEGSNYEGVSVYRAIYGNWLRKNHFLKMLAAGLEKYAIPLPTLEVPENKENTVEYREAKKALKKYTSNQANYIMYPAGWKFDVKDIAFDSDKVRETINFENQEMVNSCLLNFLLLGQQGNSGNRALGGTLSDFFGQTVQYLADHVSEVMEARAFKPLIALNYGEGVPCLVELKADALKDAADKVWADTLSIFIKDGTVKADRTLEENIRERYRYPSIDDASRDQYKTPEAPKLFSEEDPSKKKVLKLASKQKDQPEVAKLMADGAAALKEVFQLYLNPISTQYVEKVMKAKNDLSPSRKIKAPLEAEFPKTSDYVNIIKYYLTAITAKSFDQVGSYAKIKLGELKLSEYRLATSAKDRAASEQKKMDDLQRQLNAAQKSYRDNPDNMEFKRELGIARDRLNEQAVKARKALEEVYEMDAETKNRIGSKSDLLVDAQVGDIKKGISLQFQASFYSTDSDSILRKDLMTKADEIIGGPLSSTGSEVVSGQTVNDGRFDAVETLDLEDEVESYTFVNGDPVTEICQELEGRTFAANDPDLDRYTPPLHYNCKSYFSINMKSFKNNPKVTDEDLELSKKAQRSINLAEHIKEHQDLDKHWVPPHITYLLTDFKSLAKARY